MESEISIMYPEIILYALIIAGVILLIWRKKKKFKNGIIVANTKYVKKTGYFKYLNTKYHLYNILIKVTCILLILVYAVLSARLYKVKKHDEEFNNRDIMLCMDFSGSVKNLNKDIIETMKETVQTLKDERFGISIFDNTAITLVPLTTDYNYVLYTLDLMKEYINSSFSTLDNCQRSYGNNITKRNQCEFLASLFNEGVKAFEGSSLIGDGVATCANAFKSNDNRTKIIILTTDNMVSGKQTVTIKEAAAYAKQKEIKVYPIGTKTIRTRNEYRQGLVDLASTTGGVYYDFEDYSTKEINKKIEELNKSAIIKTAYVTKKDLPEMIVPYLLYILPVLFILDWRVRI